MTRSFLLFAVASIATAALIVVPARVALACSCAPQPSDEKALEASDAVFSGTVTKVTDPSAGAAMVGSGDAVFYTFDVDAVAHGEVGPEAVVGSARMDVSCGYIFEPGTRYLVFAYRGEGSPQSADERLFTNLCTNTRSLAADEELPFAASSVDGPEPSRAASEPGPEASDGLDLAAVLPAVGAATAMVVALAAIALYLHGRRSGS